MRKYARQKCWNESQRRRAVNLQRIGQTIDNRRYAGYRLPAHLGWWKFVMLISIAEVWPGGGKPNMVLTGGNITGNIDSSDFVNVSIGPGGLGGVLEVG